MNVPNILTILRIILGVIVPPLMVYGSFTGRVVAAALFITAGLTDFLDGWYARKYNLVTKLGKILDPIADKVLLLGSFFALSSLTNINIYSFWWIVPLFLREVLITAIRLVFLLKKQPLVMAADWSGKAKTIVQFGTMPVAYFIFMFSEYANWEIALWAEILLFALLTASIFVTLQSGLIFLNKNWKHL